MHICIYVYIHACIYTHTYQNLKKGLSRKGRHRWAEYTCVQMKGPERAGGKSRLAEHFPARLEVSSLRWLAWFCSA